MQKQIQGRLTIDRLCDEGCINLLKKFLKQLSREYVDAYTTCLRTHGNKDALEHYTVLRDLFTSQYFSDITNLDVKMIVVELERTYRSACNVR